MVSRKKKTKTCDKSSPKEDRISQLPDPLICHILYHLSTKDSVRTSVLSTQWRNHWRSVPALDLDSATFSNKHAFVSFAERFFKSHSESWIHKLRLHIYGEFDLTSWIDAVTRRSIQHPYIDYFVRGKIPLSIYTCETLLHLRLCYSFLPDSEVVSLPCLKIMHLEYVRFPNESTFEKLISGSPVLEDLTIIRTSNVVKEHVVVQLSSGTLKRMYIDMDDSSEVVIDAPLLQCLRTKIASKKNFQIINLGFPAKLDIDLQSLRGHLRLTHPTKVIRDILTDISRVKDLVITSDIWKEFFLYSKLRPMRKFHNLSSLNARFAICHLEMLPTLLESCTKLESLILSSIRDKEKREPNVMFAAVPRCLVSSLKVVELKLSIPRCEGEIMKLVRYLLKNSKFLEKLSLNVCHREKAKCEYLTELVAMRRCSSSCEVIVL
ncbi:hypothetical protein CARUB_v10027947mg [Capsella rubella]|uniref:F-box domain-containing protein n=1 Tax=Capsella rubella TaxID=81985 RepID=R0EZD4_9BRAS|nr:hypothetical protein CARUB_v10027947mg [Capsella rubella]